MNRRTGRNPVEERRPMAKRPKRRQLSEKSARHIRFEGDEVYVRRDGRSVVLTPKDRQPKAEQWKGFFAALDMFDPRFPLERHQPPQQKRKFLNEMVKPRPRRPKAKRK
jgi:virulence-associated protein VagC